MHAVSQLAPCGDLTAYDQYQFSDSGAEFRRRPAGVVPPPHPQQAWVASTPPLANDENIRALEGHPVP